MVHGWVRFNVQQPDPGVGWHWVQLVSGPAVLSAESLLCMPRSGRREAYTATRRFLITREQDWQEPIHHSVGGTSFWPDDPMYTTNRDWRTVVAFSEEEQPGPDGRVSWASIDWHTSIPFDCPVGTCYTGGTILEDPVVTEERPFNCSVE
jgi:hypothetical protein